MLHHPVPVTLKGKALQLLATRDYSRAELQHKLAHWLQSRHAPRTDARVASWPDACCAGNTPEPRPLPLPAGQDAPFNRDADAGIEGVEAAQAIEAVLGEMQAKGFLSDARAAQSLVHRRATTLGASRIMHELRRKGLDDDVIADAVQELQGTELERAHAVWQKKFGQIATTPAERARQMRFLASRGFGADTVRKVVQGVADD